jgi:hypothetical protein
VAVTALAVVRSLMVHTSPVPSTVSHPPQPPNVPLATAVNVTVVPLAKEELVQLTDELAQLSPAGELVTVPEPLPVKLMVRLGPVVPPPLLVPVKQITFPVMNPVTTAPVEEIPPALVLVVIVAETRVPPQESPVAVRSPVASTVIIWVSFDIQVTWFVMSFVTGGCI